MAPYIQQGTVKTVDADSDHGYLYDVLTTDGRTLHECRTLRPGGSGNAGDSWPVSEGDEVMVLCPYGDENQAVIIGTPTSSQAAYPSGFDQTARRSDGRVHEFRNDPGESVEGVLTRALLDDLSSFLQSLIDYGAAMASADTALGVPATATLVQTATAAKAVLSGTATITAAASSLKAKVDTARAGTGTGPHCSDALRASPGA